MITTVRAYIGTASLHQLFTIPQRNGEHNRDCFLSIMSFVKQQVAAKELRVIEVGLMGTGAIIFGDGNQLFIGDSHWQDLIVSSSHTALVLGVGFIFRCQ